MMDKLDIEFKFSSTGMYSPWHLDIAHKHFQIEKCESLEDFEKRMIEMEKKQNERKK